MTDETIDVDALERRYERWALGHAQVGDITSSMKALPTLIEAYRRTQQAEGDAEAAIRKTTPPCGCNCTDICSAPSIMGRQQPCRRGGTPGQKAPPARTGARTQQAEGAWEKGRIFGIDEQATMVERMLAEALGRRPAAADTIASLIDELAAHPSPDAAIENGQSNYRKIRGSCPATDAAKDAEIARLKAGLQKSAAQFARIKGWLNGAWPKTGTAAASFANDVWHMECEARALLSNGGGND